MKRSEYLEAGTSETPEPIKRATTIIVVLIFLAVLGVLVVLAVAGACIASTRGLVPSTCIASSSICVSSCGTIATCQSAGALRMIDQSSYCSSMRKVLTAPGWPSSVTVNFWIFLEAMNDSS